MNSKAHRRKTKSNSAPLEMAQFIDAGSNKIKKRIRDLERLLSKKKDVLPDTIIIEKERTLAALRLELDNAKLKQKAKENSKKYHMVRFFERKKALRSYRQALKVFNEDKENSEAKKILQERKIDLCYVVNFPKTEKYISLYPNQSSEGSGKKSAAGLGKTDSRRQAFRTMIHKQIEANSLPVSLNDILKGKKLAKESSGVLLEDVSSSGTFSAKDVESESEEEDDFFE